MAVAEVLGLSYTPDSLTALSAFAGAEADPAAADAGGTAVSCKREAKLWYWDIIIPAESSIRLMFCSN